MISPFRFALVPLLALAALAGCGRATYLERLDETRRYFDYEDRLNQSLTTVAWAGKSFQLRVPKQFRPITAKANSSEDRDPRQPTFADLELPGLQGAWEASFPLTGGENKKIPGWLYLCSNFDLLAKKSDEGKAAGFNGDLLHTVAKALGQEQSVPGLEKLRTYEVPPRGEEAFVEKRKYKVLSPGIPYTVDDNAYRVRIYCYKKDKSPAQISLIYVLPDNMVQAAALDKAIDMSLETLVVTKDKPTPGGAAKGGKGKAAPRANSL